MVPWVRATAPHEIPDRAPIRLQAGDHVVAGDRHDGWPAFVFVTGAEGCGWVPARHLSADHGPSIVLAEYDTTELAVEEGEVLDVIRRDDPSGWLWCRNACGRTGWVPASILEPATGD